MQLRDKVLALLPIQQNKLLLQWQGPYTVTEVLNDLDYKVEVGRKTKIYHANLLKKYIERPSVSSDDSSAATQIATIAVVNSDSECCDDTGSWNKSLESPNLKQCETVEEVVISSDLDEMQTEQARSLLLQFEGVFSDVPGQTSLAEHKIETLHNDPVRTKPYPLPFATNQAVAEEVQKMMEMGVIAPSHSPYNSPVVLVKKKDGSNRFCIDFRRVNAITTFDNEPMGNPEQITCRLRESQYFSKIDLSKGYWQIPIEKDSQEKTAFVTPQGCFSFRRMPFGLINSSATFNRMMRKLLEGVSHVEHYVDDILCHTRTWDEHLTVIEQVLQRLHDHGLTARPTKCHIGMTSVEFVGHVIGQGTLATEPGKIRQIQESPLPKTKKQLRSFLGLIGYYRKFISRFAELAAPLTDMTKKGKPNYLEWSSLSQQAFTTLKQQLNQTPILRLPDWNRPFILQTDASDNGVGAVLLQDHRDGLFPIAYASKKLLAREQRYSVIERECLGLVFGVRKFAQYLYGKDFILQTDHQPLLYIQRCQAQSSRILRWALYLQEYSFKIQSIKGNLNVTADYLSRMQ